MPYHYRLKANLLLGSRQDIEVWAKCDLVATVCCARLDRIKTGRGKHDTGKLGGKQVTAIRRAVAASVNETIFKVISTEVDNPQPWRALHQRIMWDGTFHGRFADKDYAISQYEKRIDEFKAHVPAERLLVFSVTEGWEPLCRFLIARVPDGPFPHLNDRESFEQNWATTQQHWLKTNPVHNTMGISPLNPPGTCASILSNRTRRTGVRHAMDTTDCTDAVAGTNCRGVFE